MKCLIKLNRISNEKKFKNMLVKLHQSEGETEKKSMDKTFRQDLKDKRICFYFV